MKSEYIDISYHSKKHLYPCFILVSCKKGAQIRQTYVEIMFFVLFFFP